MQYKLSVYGINTFWIEWKNSQKLENFTQKGLIPQKKWFSQNCIFQ